MPIGVLLNDNQRLIGISVFVNLLRASTWRLTGLDPLSSLQDGTLDRKRSTNGSSHLKVDSMNCLDVGNNTS